jgi:hypothetical protein
MSMDKLKAKMSFSRDIVDAIKVLGKRIKKYEENVTNFKTAFMRLRRIAMGGDWIAAEQQWDLVEVLATGAVSATSLCKGSAFTTLLRQLSDEMDSVHHKINFFIELSKTLIEELNNGWEVTSGLLNENLILKQKEHASFLRKDVQIVNELGFGEQPMGGSDEE